MVKELEVPRNGDLVIAQKLLDEAGLGNNLRLVIRKGIIHVLPAASDAEKILKELAGCLGEEAATDYDFGMKLGGLYEAR